MKTTEQIQSVLGSTKPEKVYGSSILRVASHFFYVSEHEPILDLADELQRRQDIAAVGVVTLDGYVSGIVSRTSLFSLLGKPYGRDILNKKNVSEITEPVLRYNVHANLFSIAEELSDALQSEKVSFYLLVDEYDRFQGIFSSNDLLRYLSRMTQEDIVMAGMLQERLVKEREVITGSDWSLTAWSHYAKGVGGDFYFHRTLTGGREFFTLCDVSGKGVAASIISSLVWGMLRMFDFRQGLRELIRVLNESIITTFHLEKYLTGMFLVYDPATKKLLSADMGHSHALILRKGRAIPLRGTSMNMPIGIDPGIDPQLYTFRLEAGDRLLVYSDGITEQENPKGEEFSEARLVAALKSCAETAADIGHCLPAVIKTFRDSTPQQDDMSFILLSV